MVVSFSSLGCGDPFIPVVSYPVLRYETSVASCVGGGGGSVLAGGRLPIRHGGGGFTIKFIHSHAVPAASTRPDQTPRAVASQSGPEGRGPLDNGRAVEGALQCMRRFGVFATLPCRPKFHKNIQVATPVFVSFLSALPPLYTLGRPRSDHDQTHRSWATK